MRDGSRGEAFDFGEVARTKVAIVLIGHIRHELGKSRRTAKLHSDSLHGCIEMLQLAATENLWVASKNLLDQR